MPIFAKIDSEGIVTETVNTTAYSILSGEYGDNEDWVQTYPNSEKRGVYATVGDIYLRTHDKFINPKPHPSWTLNSDGNWESPVAYHTILSNNIAGQDSSQETAQSST